MCLGDVLFDKLRAPLVDLTLTKTIRSLMSIKYVLSIVVLTFTLSIVGCGENEDSTLDGQNDSVHVITATPPNNTLTAPDSTADTMPDSTEIESADTTQQEDSSDVEVAGETEPVELAWDIEEGDKSKVSITANGHGYVVIPEVQGQCVAIEKNEFQDYEIPSNATIAAMSIGDKGAELFYAEEIQGEIVVYRKGAGDGGGSFKEFKRVQLK